MRLATLLAAAALATACATVPATAAQPEGGRPSIAPGDENCDVTVVFGSYAMGIDSQTFAKVDAYLKRRAPAVTAFAARSRSAAASGPSSRGRPPA